MNRQSYAESTLTLFQRDFYQATSGPDYRNLPLSFQVLGKDLGSEEVLSIEISCRVDGQIGRTEQLEKFSQLVSYLGSKPTDLQRPNIEIINDNVSLFRARLTFLAGHSKDMILPSRQLLAQVLDLAANDEILKSHFPPACGINFPLFWAQANKVFDPILDDDVVLTRELVCLFADHFRLLHPRKPLKNIDHFDPCKFDPLRLKIKSTILAGFANPIILFHTGYFFDRSLEKEGFQINWKNLFTRLFGLQEIELFGVLTQQKNFDFENNFLTCSRPFLFDDIKPPQTDLRCPFLDWNNFSTLQQLIYQVSKNQKFLSRFGFSRSVSDCLFKGVFLQKAAQINPNIKIYPLDKNPYLETIPHKRQKF